MNGFARVQSPAPARAGSAGVYGLPFLRACDLPRAVVYLGEGDWILPEGYRVRPGPIARAVKVAEGRSAQGAQAVWAFLPDLIQVIFREEDRCLELPSAFVFDYEQLTPADRSFRSVLNPELPDHHHWFIPSEPEGTLYCSEDWKLSCNSDQLK